MRIATHHVSADVTALDKNASTRVGQKAFSAKTVMGEKSVSARSLPISKEQLHQLAADLKNGVIEPEEANRRFVATVIDNSLKSKLGEHDREKLMLDIQEFFSNDQEFVKKLAKNLRDIS